MPGVCRGGILPIHYNHVHNRTWFQKSFQNVLLWHELVQFTSTRRGTFFVQIYMWSLKASVRRHLHVCVNFRTLSPLLTFWVFPLAFLWDDPDQDQRSEITRIIVDQMNRWTHSGQGFIGSFDLPWSKWSRIPDPDQVSQWRVYPGDMCIPVHISLVIYVSRVGIQ